MRKINIKDAWNHSQNTMALQIKKKTNIQFVDKENDIEFMSK
jgi:hypothetical protein